MLPPFSNPSPSAAPSDCPRSRCVQRFGRGGLSYTPQYHVSLRVGEREFFGVGANPQAARHASAAQALKVLRDLPLPGHVQGAASAGQCGAGMRNHGGEGERELEGS